MEFLSKLFKEKQFCEDINMSNLNITDLTLIYPILSKFTKLQHLNLSDNSLTVLPHDLSGLKSLTSLNINNNLFESISDIVQSLKTIPNLIVLNINLEDNDQVKIVLEELPGLQILNDQNISIEKEEEQVEPEEQEEQEEQEDQDDHQGREDVNKEQPIIKLDIEKEPIENKEEKVEKIELSPKIETEKEEPSSYSKGEALEISGDQPERLKVFAGIYESLRTLTKEKDPSKDKGMAEEFDLCITRYFESIKLSEKNQMSDIHKMRLFFPLFELCSSKLTEYIGLKDKQIEAICQLLFKEYDDALNEICEASSSSNSNQIENVNEGKKGQVDSNSKQRKELIALKEKARFLEEENKELKKRNNDLETDNRKCLEALVKHSKDQANLLAKDNERIITSSKINESPNSDASGGNKLTGRKLKTQPSGQIGQTNPKNLTLKQLKDLIQDMYIQKQKFDEKCMESKLPRETMEQYMYTYLNQRYGLKNIIIEWASAIIKGVKRFSIEDNDVCLFGKILRNECDEDFRVIQDQLKNAMTDILRDKLRRKYKLKSEGEINKILIEIQNGYIEEPFWVEIIRKMYNEEHFSILEQRIFQIIGEKSRGNMEKGKRMTREEQNMLRQQKDSKILYTEFQKVVLDFQLKSHEKYLRRFIEIFRSIDTDTNGVLNEEEFLNLINLMKIDPNQCDPNHLLQVIDPFNNQHITFSECLSLFSNELIIIDGEDEEKGQRKISLLEKFTSEQESSQ